MNSFTMVWQRLAGRSDQERRYLQAQAEATLLGHQAYALGHEHLEDGNVAGAKRWLRAAADHGVPGAEQAIKEIAGD